MCRTLSFGDCRGTSVTPVDLPALVTQRTEGTVQISPEGVLPRTDTGDWTYRLVSYLSGPSYTSSCVFPSSPTLVPVKEYIYSASESITLSTLFQVWVKSQNFLK